VNSEIVRVTFFEDRAEVARRVRLSLPPGQHRVAIEGLALTADDASLTAGLPAEAPARVLGAKIVRGSRAHPAGTAAEIEAIESDLRAAHDRTQAADRALERSQAQIERLHKLLAKWTSALERVPRKLDGWRTSWDQLEAALTRALDEAGRQQAELDAAQLDVRRAQLRLNQARLMVPRYEAAAEVLIEVTGAGELVLDLSYRTPLALWRPEHTARLFKKDGKWEMSLRTIATVWQLTGEEWRDVACRFSTARPAAAASPPLLGDDLLVLQRKQERAVTVEAREQVIHAAGIEGRRTVDEMPGVEDGGEPLRFDAARPVTIAGDGQPFRVDLGERRLPCEVDVVVFPERGEAAHVRATATLTGGPLLAGPLRLGRELSIVGRGKTAFVAQGEPFEVGFGVDDGVRVRRQLREERETTPVIGTQRLKRTLLLYLSNLGGEARRLNVVERLPVSEIEDVKIEVLDGGGARIDHDGFARFSVELTGNGTRQLKLVYQIEAAAKVRLNL
jgi:uncharacterized protein (TIGR02231 family)